GEPYLGGGARFLPRDFMKLGQMTLEGGMWNGRRIMPRDYSLRLGKPLMTLRQQRPAMHYGYLWWTIDYPYKGGTTTAYFASGNGGRGGVGFSGVPIGNAPRWGETNTPPAAGPGGGKNAQSMAP